MDCSNYCFKQSEGEGVKVRLLIVDDSARDVG